MRRILLLLVLLEGIYNVCLASNQGATDTVFYYYVSDEKQVPCFCDEILTIVREGDKIKGYFRGTSDEFEESREGYYPGFYVLETQDLKMDNGKISFVLDSRGKVFVNRPVGLDCKSDFSEVPSGYAEWLQMQKCYQKQISFSGTYDDNGLILVNNTVAPDFKLVFRKCSAETVAERYTSGLFGKVEAAKNSKK